MATIARLTRRPDFLAAAEGRRFHTERMTAQGRLRDAQDPAGLRLGFTITKRVGHAPERNRIRRRLRAAVAVVAADLPPDLAGLPADIVLIARRPALDAAFEALADDLRHAIPAVTRPGAARGSRPPGKSGRGKSGQGKSGQGKSGQGKSGRGKTGARGSGSTPLGRDAGPGRARDADAAPPTRPDDHRPAGASRSDRAGAGPVATSNACGGVPDGQ